MFEHSAMVGVSLFTEEDIISKELVDDMYLIGVDGEGVVIYGGRFGGAGYGGPGDGFYHDGSYAAVPGTICGIFDLDAEWGTWPAVTEEGVNAWTLFDLVVPEDGFIIAGAQEDMVDFVCALLPEISSEKFLAETNNAIFEEEVSKGRLNKDRVVLLDGDMYGQISLERTILEGLFLSLPTGTNKIVAGEDGTFSAEFSLALWGKARIYIVDEKGLEQNLWFDNTLVAGAVTDASKYGADWTARLYHEEGKDGYFYCSLTGGAKYKFVYNNAEYAMSIEQIKNKKNK